MHFFMFISKKPGNHLIIQCILFYFKSNQKVIDASSTKHDVYMYNAFANVFYTCDESICLKSIFELKTIH